MTSNTSFAARLRALRAKASLTQAELAERAELAHTTVQQLEYGAKLPRVDTADRLARALGVSLSSFDGCSLASR